MNYENNNLVEACLSILTVNDVYELSPFDTMGSLAELDSLVHHEKKHHNSLKHIDSAFLQKRNNIGTSGLPHSDSASSLSSPSTPSRDIPDNFLFTVRVPEK